MELDFETVRALSSPTRIKILGEVLEKETTTTDISKSLGKTKSTVSSHLSKLNEAGLVEKDEKDGRRRVIYRPTSKARDIIKGKERTVKFSIGSSALSGLAGVVIGYQGLKEIFLTRSAQDSTMNAMSMTAESAPKAAHTAQNSNLVQLSSEVMLFIGVGLLFVSATVFMYGYTVKRLSESDQS
ncbi:MAG: winged helix-turn-helix domain-containing protein [Candidatus Nanohaloarchaea archaeon]